LTWFVEQAAGVDSLVLMVRFTRFTFCRHLTCFTMRRPFISLLNFALRAVLPVLLSGCDNLISFVEGSNTGSVSNREHIIGAWGYVAPNGTISSFGFELFEDGTVRTVNTQLPDVGCWEIQGDFIMLSAQGPGGSGCDLMRSDTFLLDMVAPDKVRFVKEGMPFEFVRR
jgi:hypothetical protein